MCGGVWAYLHSVQLLLLLRHKSLTPAAVLFVSLKETRVWIACTCSLLGLLFIGCFLLLSQLALAVALAAALDDDALSHQAELGLVQILHTVKIGCALGSSE
jgi:hypothetical protein